MQYVVLCYPDDDDAPAPIIRGPYNSQFKADLLKKYQKLVSSGFRSFETCELAPPENTEASGHFFVVSWRRGKPTAFGPMPQDSAIDYFLECRSQNLDSEICLSWEGVQLANSSYKDFKE